jgi:hypothetical protein
MSGIHARIGGVESAVDAAASRPLIPGPGGGAVKAWTIAASATYSLVLAAGGGYVFYASIRPVSIPKGYGDFFADGPWETGFLLLGAVLVLGPVMLLALGLDQRVHARLTWWFAVWPGFIIGCCQRRYTTLKTPNDLLSRNV